MNGVNEVQSSSMVQQRNGLILSPIATTTSIEEERIDTIPEENGNGDDATTVNLGPESIPTRVLTEISIPMSSTQSTPVTAIKKPIENPLRDSGISNDKVNY